MKTYSKDMKDRVKPLFHILLIFTLLISYCHQVFGQEQVNISAGFGIPELSNIGVRYQLDQVQIGLSVGSMPVENGSIISILGDIRYHFGGFSELSNRRPWYGRIGLNYLRDETENLIHKYLYFNTRIGRDFNISNKIGVEIDIGAIFQLSHEEIRKKPSNGCWICPIEFPVLPSVGIGLFYRV